MSKTLNMLKLILRNLTYYKKKQINVILGVALGAAILIGALIIGDSVRYSLQRIVYKRLGKIQYSMTSGDRVFRRQLADDISGISKVNTSAVLHSKGVLISGGGQARLNNIQFYGVDQNFDNLSLVPGMYRNLAPNEIVVNSYAASKLSLSAGDEVLLRFEKLDNMPKDSPLADDSEITVAERFLVKSIADDDNFGRFGLKSEQIAPFNVFLTIDKLSSLMEMDNSANMLLVAAYPDETITLDEINASLSAVWQLEDSGLKLLVIEDQRQVELRSKRIFIDEPVIDAARKTGIS